MHKEQHIFKTPVSLNDGIIGLDGKYLKASPWISCSLS